MTKNDRLPRGSNPPFIAMGEALSIASELYERAGGSAPSSMLSSITGNSPSSSSFTKKLNALKTYGLVDEQEKGQVALTALGVRAAAPSSEKDRNEARKAMLLQIDVFEQLYRRLVGKLLPADEFLKNIIEQECGRPRSVVEAWVEQFKDALESAGLLFRRMDGKAQIVDVAVPPETPAGDPAEPEQKPEQKLEVVATPHQVQQLTVDSDSGHKTRIALSGGRVALFEIPDSLTKGDAKKLKGALSGLEAIITAMVADDTAEI